MKKHLKVLASALTVMLVAGALIGCGKKNSTTSPAGNDTKSTSSVPSGKTILIWSHFGDNEYNEFKKQAEAWATKTNNKVTVVKDNNDFDKLVVAAKSPSAPDVMWGLPHDHLGQFATAGILDEIPADLVKSDDYVSQDVINAGKYDGKQLGLPIYAETYALFYNKDKVPTAPTTWEDMLTKGKIQWDLTNFYFTYGVLATQGAYVFKTTNGVPDPTNLGLNVVDGYKTLQDLVTKGMVDKNATGDVPKNNFKTGKCEFYISGPWDVADMQKANLNFGVAKLPTIAGKPGKSFMGVQLGYVIKKNRDADQKAAITDLMKFLSSQDSLTVVGKAGNRLPVKKGIAVEGVSQGFADQIANAEPMPNIPQMQGVWDPAKQGLTLLLNGTKDAQQTADYLQTEVGKKVQSIK